MCNLKVYLCLTLKLHREKKPNNLAKGVAIWIRWVLCTNIEIFPRKASADFLFFPHVMKKFYLKYPQNWANLLLLPVSPVFYKNRRLRVKTGHSLIPLWIYMWFSVGLHLDFLFVCTAPCTRGSHQSPARNSYIIDCYYYQTEEQWIQ